MTRTKNVNAEQDAQDTIAATKAEADTRPDNPPQVAPPHLPDDTLERLERFVDTFMTVQGGVIFAHPLLRAAMENLMLVVSDANGRLPS